MKVSQTGNHSIQGADANAAKRGAQSTETQRADRSDRSERIEKADPSAKNTSGAKAEISAKSREFSQAKAVATQTPDVREDRVAELKKKIAEGSYRIDDEAIAERMVDEHLRGPRTN